MKPSARLRPLFERVHASKGPLSLFTDAEGVEHVVWEDAKNRVEPLNAIRIDFLDEPDRSSYEALAGILRTDLVARTGRHVRVEEFPATTDTPTHIVTWHDSDGNPAGEGRANDVLAAHLLAWLNAHSVLTPRDDATRTPAKRSHLN